MRLCVRMQYVCGERILCSNRIVQRNTDGKNYLQRDCVAIFCFGYRLSDASERVERALVSCARSCRYINTLLRGALKGVCQNYLAHMETILHRFYGRKIGLTRVSTRYAGMLCNIIRVLLRRMILQWGRLACMHVCVRSSRYMCRNLSHIFTN